MIIDITKPEFADIPATLNGEILLGRPPAGGFITVTLEVARNMKAKSDSELEAIGWLEYRNIIDAIK